MKNEIILFENQDVKLEVNMNGETVWLTQDQMAKLFGKDRTVITRHINNIFKDGELEEKSNVQKMHIANSDKPVSLYSLDVIISIGYRVKSQNGVIFRKWANKVLKDYLLKGYAVNQKRLEYLEKTIKLIDIAGRMDTELKTAEAKEIIKVINKGLSGLILTENTSSVEMLSTIIKEDSRELFCNNYHCTSLDYQYDDITENQIYDITSKIIDKFDDYAIVYMNDRYFKDHLLMLVETRQDQLSR